MKETYYIWEDGLSHDYKGMLKTEYDRVIWNAHNILDFKRRDGWQSLEEVKEYCEKYFNVEVQIIKR